MWRGLRFSREVEGSMTGILHPTIDPRKQLYFLRVFGEQGSPLSTQMLHNRVGATRHGLILRENGATAYTELLEPDRLQYLCVFDPCFIEIIDFPCNRV